jgi:nucleoid-associated protein YgaU
MSTMTLTRPTVSPRVAPRPRAVVPPVAAGRPLPAVRPRAAAPAPAAVRPRVAAPPVAVRPRATGPASASGGLRLTRRGRLVVVLLFLGLLLAVLTAYGARSAATREPGAPLHTRTVVVEQGDTLWDIAASAAKPGQVREMVHEIEELNAMTGPGLTVGQQVAVPVG